MPSNRNGDAPSQAFNAGAFSAHTEEEASAEAVQLNFDPVRKEVRSDGSYAFTSASESLLMDTWTPSATRQQLTRLNEAALFAAADAIRVHSAVDTFFSLGAVDSNAIISLLKGMSPSDRRLVEAAYNSKHGDWALRDMLKSRSGVDWAQMEILLNADEGEANFAGYVHHAIEKLQALSREQASSANEGGKQALDEPAEKLIRQTIAVMNASQIEDMMRDYKRLYGQDIGILLFDASTLSEKTRRALQIYLKGTDQRTGDDTMLLGSLALEHGDEDMFQEAFRGAPQEIRDKFRTAFSGHEQIGKNLYWADRSLAHDYLDSGHAGLTTLIEANTHWLHKNKEAIKLAIDSATDEERELFRRGRNIRLGRASEAKDDDKALRFYDMVHEAFGKAAYEWEVHGWESRLATGSPDGLIERVSRTHSDGFLGSALFSSTDVNALLEEIKQMTETEWSALRSTESLRQDLDTAIDAIWMSDTDRLRIDELLARKLSAATFEESMQSADVRDTFERFRGAGLLPIGRDSQKLIDGLIHMHIDQQKQFKEDPAFREFVRNYVQTLDDGAHKVLGERMLDKLSREPSRLKLDAVDTFLYDSMDSGANIKLLNTVQTDQELRAAIKSDPLLKDILVNALMPDASATVALPGSPAAFALAKRARERMVDQLLVDGFLPLSSSLSLANNQSERFHLLLTAPDSEIEKLASAHGDQPTKDILKHFDYEEQSLITSIIARTREDGGGSRLTVSAEDYARAYVLGLVDSEKVAGIFGGASMTPSEKADARVAYAQKYHSDMMSDVLQRIPQHDRTAYERILTHAVAADASVYLEESLKSATSRGPLDDWMKEGWDATIVQRSTLINDYGAQLADASKVFGDLPQSVQDVLTARIEQAIDLYRNSKQELAENTINAIIMAVAFAASAAAAVPTGGASVAAFATLAKLNVARMAVLGAALKVGGKAVVEDSDYDASAGAIVKDLAEGAMAGAIMRVGPAELGNVFKPFQQFAVRTTSPIMSSLRGVVSSEQAQAIHLMLERKLPETVSNIVGENLSNKIGAALKFGPEATRAVQSVLADRLPRTIYGIVNGQSVQEAAAQLIDGLPVAMDAGARAQFIKEAEQLLLKEMNAATQKFLVDTARGYAQSTALGATSGFATGVSDGMFNWDAERSVEENLEDILEEAMASANDGAEMAFLLHSGISGAIKTGKFAAHSLDGTNHIYVDAEAKLGARPSEPPALENRAIVPLPTRAVKPQQLLKDMNIGIERRGKADGWTTVEVQNKYNPGEFELARIHDNGAIQVMRNNQWTSVSDPGLDFWRAVKDELGMSS